MLTIRVILLVAGTLFIVWFSWWASIKNKRYHGYYRFFSFESLLLLLILNAKSWFVHPFSWHQVLSWIFLIFSLVLAIYGFKWLVTAGKPQGKFENTSRVITTGAYRFIRHPLYTSLLLLGTGIWLKSPFSLASLALFLVNTLSLYLTARADEKEMIQKFGADYEFYMKNSKMFIPFIF